MPDDTPSLVSPPVILTPTLAAVDDADEELCEELTRGRGRKAAEDADADGGGGGIGTPALSPPTCAMLPESVVFRHCTHNGRNYG